MEGDPAVGDADAVAAEAELWLVSVVAEVLLVRVAVAEVVVDVDVWLLSSSRGDMTLSITCIKPLLVLLKSVHVCE